MADKDRRKRSFLIAFAGVGCLGGVVALFTVGVFGLGILAGSGGIPDLGLLERAPDEFGEEHPYAVEAGEFRSIHLAERLVDRLHELGLHATIISVRDDERGGLWHKVVTGASESELDTHAHTAGLEGALDRGDLKVVTYGEMAPSVQVAEVQETRRITVDAPDVPDPVLATVRLYPFSNAYNIQRLTVYASPDTPGSNDKHADMLRRESTDLPRGISRADALRDTDAFSEAILVDNLSGDRVTLNVFRMRASHGIAGDVAAHYAQAILDTGTYQTEQQTPISVDAAFSLDGFKVVIEPRAGEFRTYVVVADPSERWVVFTQTTRPESDDMKSVLARLGSSDGMLEYSEFYNTFHTVPTALQGSDSFVGFSMTQLDRSYAINKGNPDWAKALVGHWTARAYLHSSDDGPWSYGLFDLLTQERNDEIYGMYDAANADIKSVSVYGTTGHLVYETRFSQRSYNLYNWPNEVNFHADRYICMVNNAEQWGRLDSDELIARANSLQLGLAGGYAKGAATEAPSSP